MAGLTSLPRKMNIKGQPHNLAYINKTESDILKSIGGAGKPRKGTKGVPSYDFADVGVDDYDVMGSDAQAEADAAQEAADAAFDDANMGQDFDLMNQFDPTLGIAAPSPNEMNTIAMLSAQTPTQAMAERESLANAVAEAQSAGVISYNEALDFGKHGYLNLLEQVEREDDLATARGIEGLYGLREGDVTPAPVGGFSYQGPGSTRAALSEMGKGAINLGSLLAETYPGLVNFASIIAEEEFGLKMPSLGLKEQLDDYFARDAASQREANIGAREGTGTIIDDFEEESVAGLFDPELSSPQMQSVMGPTAIEAEQAQAEQQAEQNTQTSYPAFDNFDLGENDPETFLPPIPSVPTVAPKPAAEVVIPESKVRTAATDTFRILVDTYGPEVAAQLLPNRLV